MINSYGGWWLAGGGQQLRPVAFPFTSWPEGVQQCIYTVFGRAPSLVAGIVLQPHNHGPMQGLDAHLRLGYKVLEAVAVVVFHGGYNNLLPLPPTAFKLE